jgi:hypothetical protein
MLKEGMNTFYVALPYLLILAQCVCPAMLAYRYARSRSVKLKWLFALLATLPIPALVAAFAVFAFQDALMGRSVGCSFDGCASDRAAIKTLMGSALALFLIGLVCALWASRKGKVSVKGPQ